MRIDVFGDGIHALDRRRHGSSLLAQELDSLRKPLHSLDRLEILTVAVQALLDYRDGIVAVLCHAVVLLERFLNEEVADRQIVDIRAEEAIDGVVRSADNRFALDVERGVDQHRNAAQRLEFLKQTVK